MSNLTTRILSDLEIARDYELQRLKSLQSLTHESQEVVALFQNLIITIRRGEADFGEQLQKHVTCQKLETVRARVAATEYVGVSEACHLTGLAPTTIQSWCRGPLSDVSSRRGKAWRVKREALLQYAAQKNYLQGSAS